MSKNIWQDWIAAAGIAAVVAATLVGCSTADTGTGSSTNKTLTVATDNPSALQPVIDAFKKANPGATITCLLYTSDAADE